MNFLIFLFILIVSPIFGDDETDSKASKYLKQCGFLTSLSTTKCVLKSVAVQRAIKHVAKSRDGQDLTNIKKTCGEVEKCLEELNCKPAIDDNKNTLDFCWRAGFNDRFNKCEKKLLEVKLTKEGECLKDYKNNLKKTIKEMCYFLKNSRDCMKQHITTQCGAENEKDWNRFSSENYKLNDCFKLTGLAF